MELLGETAIKSIAELCGVKLSNNEYEQSDELSANDKRISNNSSDDNSENKCTYIIRKGNEEDVLQDTKR